jgi:hypothetical protein
MKNYFSWKSNGQVHFSVGAVVVRNGKIACHHFSTLPSVVFDLENVRDVYLLMRETPEPNEPLEAAVARGLEEEFGMTATVRTYLGSILCNFSQFGKTIDKTTAYFLCDFVSIDESKRHRGDAEARSIVEWHEPDFLIEKMRAQGTTTKRADLDEAAIIEQAKTQL